MSVYRGVVRNGKVEIEGEHDLKEGTRVFVSLVELEEIRGITVEELLNAPFIGLWADRDDIGDTAEFVEKLRREAERRE